MSYMFIYGERMINPGDIIKHNNSMDVCFNVLSIDTYSSIWLCGRWINMGFTKSWIIDSEPVVINIQANDISNWKVCDNITDDCYRYSDWRSI